MDISNRSALTNREVIEAFRSFTDGTGMVSDSSAWSVRVLLRHLLFYRAPLLAARINSGDNSYRLARQTIPCIRLIDVDLNECPCAPQSGCTWKRTDIKIPDSIGKFLSVNSIDGSITYGYRNWDDVRYKFSSRVQAIRKAPTYSTKNGYIYVHNDNHKKFISLTGVFSDPRQVQLLPDCAGNQDKCVRPLDLEFPFDPEMFPALYEATLQRLLNINLNVPQDVQNDDKPTRVSS